MSRAVSELQREQSGDVDEFFQRMSLEAKRMIQHLSTRRSQIQMARTSSGGDQSKLNMLSANLGLDVAEDDGAFDNSMLVHGSRTSTGLRGSSAADTISSDVEGDRAPTHPSDRAPSPRRPSHRGQPSASATPANPLATSNGRGTSATAEQQQPLPPPPHGYIFDDRYALLKQQLISIASDTNALDGAIGYPASQDQNGERGSSATAHIDPAEAAALASPESKACADAAAARHPPQPQRHPEEPMRLGAMITDLGDQDRFYVKASYC